jgi:hypothetical protein
MATLRPLLKQFAFRLGLTSKPVSVGPSGYRNNSRTAGPGTPKAFSGRDAYTLSSVSRNAPEKRGTSFFSGDVETGIKKEIKWEVKISRTAASESQEELHSPMSARTRNVV